jgi:predicted Zn-dependent protease with MMP-like domain
MTKEQFEEIVKQAFRKLPKIFRKKLLNVEIVIEDEPIAQKSLLGLYQGVPLKSRGFWYGNVMPDKITLFKNNIERISRNEEEVIEWINKVLIHEIGHYFGFDDEDLRNLGG